MNNSKCTRATLAALLAQLTFLPGLLSAQGPPAPNVVRSFQYAAKFVCTVNIPGTTEQDTSVVPGVYATHISLHNPTDQTIQWPQFRMKIAVVSPADPLSPGPVSGWMRPGLTLRGDDAMELNCRTLAQRFGLSPIRDFKGFLVIQSPVSLDVAGVYTAGSTSGVPSGVGGVADISVLQISERVIDLVAGCDLAQRECRAQLPN